MIILNYLQQLQLKKKREQQAICGSSIYRERPEGHEMLEHNCFAETPLYPPHFFQLMFTNQQLF